MEQVQEDDFKFFISDINIEKSKDDKGIDIMKVGGIATTKDKDSDDEEIDPKGWDTSYFLNNGFFNYNHQAKFNPKAVIGEPTAAKVTKDGVYVEGFLYSDSDLAKSVYDTTQMLSKSSGNRRMGFSIEGKAMERDPFDNNKITKARLTGCALTLNPKNPNTLVNIIKGEYHNDDLEYDSDDVTKSVEDNIEKSEDCIIHLEKDGKILQIDNNFNIKITESKVIEKSITTSSASAVIPESVDQDTKDKIKLPIEGKNLTKGEVYSEIFNYIYEVDLEKADLMYKIIEATAIKRTKMENNTNTDKVVITKDDLQKSLDIVLNTSKEVENSLEKSEKSDNLIKGKKDTGYEYNGKKYSGKDHEDMLKSDSDYKKNFDGDMEKAMGEDEEYQKLKKAMGDYESKIQKGEVVGYPSTIAVKNETMIEDASANTVGSGKEGQELKKSEEDKGDPEEGEEKPKEEAPIEKSEDSNVDLIKGMQDAVSAGLQPTVEMIQGLGQVAQGLIDQNEELQKSIDAANDDRNSLKKSLDETMSQVNQIANTPIPSKTVHSNNYKKHPSLEKSEDGSGNQLHVIANKDQILDILDRKAGLDGDNPNMAYAQAMASFESSGALEKGMIDDIKKSEGIDIII